MQPASRHRGFSMLELLIAVALMATVVTVLYGTVVAVSNTTQTTRNRIGAAQRCTRALGQITAAIRCTARPDVQTVETTDLYFQGATRNHRFDQLQWVSAQGIGAAMDLSDGPFHTRLRFDRGRQTLWIEQRPFVPGVPLPKKATFKSLLLDDVVALVLSFSDGEDWHNQWTLKQEKTLPEAVRITITVRDKADRLRSFTAQTTPLLRVPLETETAVAANTETP